MAYRDASRHYNVPETLRRHVTVEMGAKSGPPTIFTALEEGLLSWLICIIYG